MPCAILGPMPVTEIRSSEERPFLLGGEAVELERVLPHMQIREEGDRRDSSSPSASNVERGMLTPYPTPWTSMTISVGDFATSVPRSDAIMA